MLSKKQILKNKWFLSKKGSKYRYVVKKIFWIVQSEIFLGAGAGDRVGAGDGEKNTWSRSKTDRLRNTVYSTLSPENLPFVRRIIHNHVTHHCGRFIANAHAGQLAPLLQIPGMQSPSLDLWRGGAAATRRGAGRGTAGTLRAVPGPWRAGRSAATPSWRASTTTPAAPADWTLGAGSYRNLSIGRALLVLWALLHQVDFWILVTKIFI